MDPEMMEEMLPVFVPVAVYWITSGIYHLLVIPREEYRLFSKEEEDTQNLATPRQVVLGVLANHVMQIALATFQFTYFRKVTGSVGNPHSTTLLQKLGQMAVAMLVLDAWEYFWHKWTHENQFLYKHVHAVHHYMMVPYAYGGQYLHLVDAFVGQLLGTFVSLTISGMSPRTAAVFISVLTVKNVDDHCSRWFPNCNPFQRFFGNNTAFHAVHHQLQGFKYNYSIHFLTTWDLLLGTYLPYSVEERKGGGYEIRTALKLGGPGKLLDEIFSLSTWGQTEELKIPQARGSVAAVGAQAFFIPLYDLFLIYGGIFRLTFGPKSFLIVSDPAIAKHILRDNAKGYSKGILAEILEFVMGTGLIPADGDIWLARRRTVVPALHHKYVAAMIQLFSKATNKLCLKLNSAASTGEDVEMESLFSRLTLDIIGKAVFNYDFDSLTNDEGIVEAVYTVLREAEMRSLSPIPTWEIPIWKDISPRQKKVSAALKLINVTLDSLIDICKKMVEEEELQFHEEYMNEQDPSILHFLLASGDDVTSKQLRDDLMTMLIAGHETSAAVLTWTFYLLSKEPAVMKKLQEEVDNVLGDRFPTVEDMKKLKYTSRVISESLRLYPQPPVLIRRSIGDDVLGGYPIKKGEDIFISLWNLHRSPHHWTEADSFNPERWPLDGPNPNEVNQNFSYLPFGGGPRKCIGDMFASFEAIVAVAMLVRRFDFQMAPGAPPVEMTTGATIHTTEGLKMVVKRRRLPPVNADLVGVDVDQVVSV